MNFYVDDYIKDDITKGINECISAASGKGIVIFSKNKEYKTKTINLLSNTTLYLEENSKIILDTSMIEKEKGLDVPSWQNCDYNGNPKYYFIYGKDLENIKIDGLGSIVGSEEYFYGNITKYHIEGSFYPRVPMIYLENCLNIEIKNVTLTKSGFWTVHLVGSKNILIDSIKILNNRIFTNTDGIDPDSSKNIVIRNCYIEAADDAIVLKTTKNNDKYGCISNVEVYNNTLISTSAAIKIGTESNRDFNDIYFHDNKIIDSNRGISIQLRDGASISNLVFENIEIKTHRFHPLEWWGKGEGIFLSNIKRYDDSKLGSMKNISFKNIKIEAESGIILNGVNNINFENIDLNLKKITEYDSNTFDIRPTYIMNEPFKDTFNLINIKNSNNIIFNNFKYNIDDNIKDLIDSNVSINNSTDINFK